MANCLHCIHHQIYPKDLAILRMSNDPNIKIRYKCIAGDPKIRNHIKQAITAGACTKFKPSTESHA